MKEIKSIETIRKTIFVYAISMILIVGVLVALASIWPFYNDLKQSESKRLLFAVKSRAMTVEETLSKMEQVALQITSRSRMRDVLEDYNHGEISQTDFVTFTQPKLEDPLSRSKDAVSIIRLDLKNTVAVTAGLVLSEEIWRSVDLTTGAVKKYGPIRIKGKPYLLVSAPIQNRQSQRVGTDLVLFDLSSLNHFIQDNSGLGKTGKTFLGTRLGNAVKLFFQSSEEDLENIDPLIAGAIRQAMTEKVSAILPSPGNNRKTVAFSKIKESPWAIVVEMDNRELYAQVNQELVKVAAVIMGLIIAGIIIVRQLLRPLTGRVIIHTEQLQNEICEKNLAVASLEKAEKDLIDSNTLLTYQLETALDGVLVVNTEGTIISHNQRFAQVWGIPPEILDRKTSKSVLEYLVDLVIEPDVFLSRIKELYASHETKGRENLRLKDGRILDRFSAPMRAADGAYSGRIWYFRDITEQENLKQELLKMEKLESIGVLAGGLAHDFNNILAAILGNLNLAIRRSSEEKVVPLLKTAEKASLRAKGLTRQLLTFSKGGSPIKRVVTIDTTIQEAAEFVLRGSKSSIEYNFAGDLEPVEIDSDQIAQVVQNIVLNASHAMPEGGTISVNCANIYFSQGPNAQLETGNYIKISITDTGIGIPADQISKVFDPYYTTKPTGSGLGLSICHSIISKHAGHIDVDSQPGIGTTFYIYLPAYGGNYVEDQKQVEKLASKGTGLIIFMDDDEMLRKTAEEMLHDAGYQVLQAANGEEALSIYQEKGDSVAAIIMDLTIPGNMGGQEAVQKILEINPQAKVIVSSGYSHDPVMANYQSYGFAGVLEKPYTWQELESVLHKALREC